MPISAVLSYVAAYFSLIVAALVLLRDRDSFVHRIFAAGMLVFAVEQSFWGISYQAGLPQDVFYWQKRIFALTAVMPALWIAFSLSYARIRPQQFLSRWK